MTAIVHTEAMTATQRASLAYTLATLDDRTSGVDKNNEEVRNV